jgi:hypothetical protein
MAELFAVLRLSPVPFGFPNGGKSKSNNSSPDGYSKGSFLPRTAIVLKRQREKQIGG